MKKAAPYIIGTGLVLFVVHNPYQPLLKYVFMPWIGLLMIVFGSIPVVQEIKDWGAVLGQKGIWIPLAAIATSIAGSGVVAWVEGRQDAVFAYGAVCLAVVMFMLYIVSRVVDKKKLMLPMTVAAVVESVSIIAWGAMNQWKYNGGLVSPTNYDMATGVVVVGVLVAPEKQRWWLATIGATGLFFSGSAEAIFVGIVLLAAVLVKRSNWNWRTVAPIGMVVVCLAITISTGIVVEAQMPNIKRLVMIDEKYVSLPGDWSRIEERIKGNGAAIPSASTDAIVGYRLTNWQPTIPIKLVGYGINLTNFYPGIPHNVVLIIVEQVGVIAALAWLIVAWQGIRRKEWRYLWIGIVALGVFDHFIWTQAAPWFWAIAGVSLGENGEEVSD